MICESCDDVEKDHLHNCENIGCDSVICLNVDSYFSYNLSGGEVRIFCINCISDDNLSW